MDAVAWSVRSELTPLVEKESDWYALNVTDRMFLQSAYEFVFKGILETIATSASSAASLHVSAPLTLGPN